VRTTEGTIMPRTIGRLIFAWLLLAPGLAAAEEKIPADRRVDRYGDPLPPGAVACLGSLRLVGPDWPGNVAFSPDGKLLASGGPASPVSLWDVSTGKEIRQLLEKKDTATPDRYANFPLAFSPNGSLLFSGSEDQDIHVWDVATGKELRRLRGHVQTVFSVACSPDGKLVASASLDGSVRLWDVARGKEMRRLSGH